MSPSERSGQWRIGILYLCYLVSGVAGLIYEVLWSKYLALCVGSTGMAQVIVLATFMGGMALGSHLLGRAADRVVQPLKLYVYLELAIGAYGLLFEPVFLWARGVFIAVATASGLSAGGLTGGKIATAVLTILLPSFLMGGTLPAIGRHLVRRMADVGPHIARLYFTNSLGAVAGCLLAGFFLIRCYGLQFSMVTGAALSILAGLTALALSRAPEAPLAAAEAEAPAAPACRDAVWAPWIVLAAVSLSGAVSMMYEVA